ncbi:MAG TPA: hypothetical protein VFE05_11985 [Longimicrobiaceae bacterium]|jgi:hypothetical protein|nr:hypothetical protein [Longimicrobiaceae bacterium]
MVDPKMMEKLLQIGENARSARVGPDFERFSQNFDRADRAIRQIDERMARRRSLIEVG